MVNNVIGMVNYVIAARPSLLNFVIADTRPRVAALLAELPEMPATVIAERVGWDGSMSWFRENVARLRPEHRRPDPADRLTDLGSRGCGAV
jgi:hypothetical protein